MNWTDVANAQDFRADDTDTPNGTAYVTADAWARDVGVTVRLRLYNVTDSQAAGESADITAIVPTDASFPVTLGVGSKHYRLQVGSDTPGAEVFAIGMISGV